MQKSNFDNNVVVEKALSDTLNRLERANIGGYVVTDCVHNSSTCCLEKSPNSLIVNVLGDS